MPSTPAFAPVRLLAAGACALLLAACTQTGSSSTPSGPARAAASLDLPSSGSCAREIAQFRALLDRDNETGFVGASVYRDATAALEGPAATCRAGNDGAAIGELRAVKQRFGYPA